MTTAADPAPSPFRPSPDRPPSLREQPLTSQEQALVESHVALAFHLVRRKYGDHPCCDDLVQEAAIGVMEAARRFDPSRGFAFGTYSGWWIKSRISAFMKRRARGLKIDGASSFDDPAGPAEPADPSADCPFEVVALHEEFALDSIRLQSALAGLQPRERDVLWRRARGETLKVIGEAMGVSKERVRQIEAQALEKSRAAAGRIRAA